GHRGGGVGGGRPGPGPARRPPGGAPRPKPPDGGANSPDGALPPWPPPKPPPPKPPPPGPPPTTNQWMSPAATSCLNCASVGAGSPPLKPPIAITDWPLASCSTAAVFEPTDTATPPCSPRSQS